MVARLVGVVPVAVSVQGLDGKVLAGSGPDRRADDTRTARAPILVSGAPVGTVVATPISETAAKGEATTAAGVIAQLIGEWVTQEVEAGSMTTELLARYEEITLLYDLSEALGSVFDVRTLCAIALERSLKVIEAGAASIGLIEQDAGALVVLSRHSETSALGVQVAKAVTETGKQILLQRHEPWGPDPGLRADEAVLSVPLLLSSAANECREALGALTLFGGVARDAFTAGDARLAAAVAAQLAVAIQNSRLVESLRGAERAQREMEIAAGIQRTLLPSGPPELADLDVAGLCIPAENVGGDYYDFFVDDDGRLTVVIADVAGHSIGSALMMAMGRAILRREVGEGKSPGQILYATNEALLDDLVHAGLFITVFCARFDPARTTLSYASGGHNPPLIQRAAGGPTEELDAEGMPFGFLGGVEYEEHTVSFGAGDTALLYTDGAVEARDATGEQFGEDRLSSLLRVAPGVSASELAGTIHAAVRSHVNDAPPQDDVTLVVLRARAGGRR